MMQYLNEQVIKPKLARPGRIPVTTCAWDRDGKRIAGGIGDGSIQVLAESLLLQMGSVLKQQTRSPPPQNGSLHWLDR